MTRPWYEWWRSQADGQWYFHLRAANNKTVQPSQSYATKAGVLRGIAAAKRASARADVRERKPYKGWLL
jgi:uncharacterized protein YegP (UPF0339 family)